jgi:glutamate N-acetyltransferase/amino-acid N-acetyltransferase
MIMQIMKIYKKAWLPLGFKANAIYAGIKRSKKLDLGLIFSKENCKAAALFTVNRFAAAPVVVSKNLLKSHNSFHGVIVNSGNANCFTGKNGISNAKIMSEKAAANLCVKPKDIFVASTGIIGKPLAIKKIVKAIPELAQGLSYLGIKKFSQAIMTTDKFKKEITLKTNIGGKQITICGVAKGAGMIFPNMATMLCFILTDVNIEKKYLENTLEMAVVDSFNSISVDACQSTNDTVLILTNGLAKNKILNSKSQDYSKFLNALKFVCLELAKMIVKDGEGATKIIQIDVSTAKSKDEAKKLGFIVANSNLFKTAMYGADPNFGRVVQAVGASGLDVKEKDLKINFSPLNKKEVKIRISLGRGKYSATVYTSDLTPEYIRINSKYN